MNRIWGASRGPPWGWIVSSPDQKPEDLNAILRDGGGLQGLAVQLGQGDPNAFEPEQPMSARRSQTLKRQLLSRG